MAAAGAGGDGGVAKPAAADSARVEAASAWRPSARSMLGCLLVVRAVGARVAPVMDCDEAFNYLEPVHYLLRGSGMQTWEYSPAYALRSYAFVELYAIPVRLALDVFGLDKVRAFFVLRAALGALCAACEAAFCDAAARRLGPRVGLLAFCFSASASGMFHAAVATLPSTACMYAVLLGFAAWLRGRPGLGLWCGAFAVLLGMPVAAPLFVPMGVDALRPGVLGPCKVAAIAAQALVAFAALPSVLDGWYYGTQRPVWAMGNHLLYNVAGVGGGGAGADLYGTEPWTFYAKNLLLNFNAVALLAAPSALAPVMRLALQRLAPSRAGAANAAGSALHPLALLLVVLLPMYATLGVFFAMAHKEERFLTMVYPLICLAAAITADFGLGALEDMVGAISRRCGRAPDGARGGAARALAAAAAAAVVALAAGLSASRSAALHFHFGAPLRVYESLYYHVAEGLPDGPEASQHLAGGGGVCVGKEWYRFPSSFFLPAAARATPSSSLPLLWLNSSFGGQLPRPYGPWPRGLSDIPPHMNDRNAREESRFSSPESCKFLVDFELAGEPPVDAAAWAPVRCEPFLDADRSPLPWRAFYLPGGVTNRRNTFGNYCVWQRRLRAPRDGG